MRGIGRSASRPRRHHRRPSSKRSTTRWKRIWKTGPNSPKSAVRFHDAIVHGCGNKTIIAVVGTLETLWTSHEQQWADESAAKGTYPSLTKRRAVLNTHIKMAEMIAAGDVERARRVAARHLSDTQSHVLAAGPDQRIYALSPQALSRPRDNRHL